MFYQVKKYFSFLITSKNKHGVQSPFVFDIVTKCFNVKTSFKLVLQLKEYQSFLKQNNSEIEVTDFGTGSRIFKTNKRIVSDIYKHVVISNKDAALLTRLVSYFNFTNILEIGTSLGVGTLALALGNRNAKITTLEGCPETLKISKANLNKYVNNEINFMEGEFDKTLPKVLKNREYDLIYFDGNHQKEPTIDYFEQCLQSINNDTVFIFDDIYWSKEMTEAWEYIKKHQKVKLTIDIYNLGFVFFRKEQYQKEHFKIRM